MFQKFFSDFTVSFSDSKVFKSFDSCFIALALRGNPQRFAGVI